ncbi:MAG: tetratricopeptide (TPR) repeat protein [Cyclobacteriaceae bacterium]|jgi:tetratricopeptide (TPR) repeat protein
MNFSPILLIIVLIISCSSPDPVGLDMKILSSLGAKHRNDWEKLAAGYEEKVILDSADVTAWLALAETKVIIYIFGFTSREGSVPMAKMALKKALALDSTSSEVYKITGILSFLDWDWQASEKAFLKSISTDSMNLSARHWYSLWLAAMGRFDEAMAQSDTIVSMDTQGNFMIGRGSMLYFARRFEEMKSLMKEAVAKDTMVAWGYDWLGMAYVELKEYDKSIETYYKAFELSDGTVEVGAGLGHALGQAGQTALAKEMADYYEEAAQENYLPPVQRAFVHIGIKEYDKALELLEQAYKEKSWFIIFIRSEPWYDPIRRDRERNVRFQKIVNQMGFP